MAQHKYAPNSQSHFFTGHSSEVPPGVYAERALAATVRVPTIDVEDWQRNTEVHGQLIVGYPRRHNML